MSEKKFEISKVEERNIRTVGDILGNFMAVAIDGAVGFPIGTLFLSVYKKVPEWIRDCEVERMENITEYLKNDLAEKEKDIRWLKKNLKI